MNDEPGARGVDLSRMSSLASLGQGVWVGLLGTCLFVGIVVLGHKDGYFFSVGSETFLPVLYVSVPTRAFMIMAPLLLTVPYLQLQVQLVELWDGLGEAPATVDGAPLIEALEPSLIGNAAVLYRQRVRQDGSARERVFDRLTEWLTLGLVWVSAPVLVFALLGAAMSTHELGLTLWNAACFLACVWGGYAGSRVARVRLSGGDAADAHGRWPIAGRVGFATLTLLLLGVGWVGSGGPESVLRSLGVGSETPERVEGRVYLPKPKQEFLIDAARWFAVHADLNDTELSVRPKGWKLFGVWLQEYEAGNPVDPDEPWEWEETARERYRDYLRTVWAPTLRGVDWRAAQARNAFLPAADLRESALSGASLHHADLQGVRFDDGELVGVDLYMARAQGASFKGANLRWAQMFEAELHWASFSYADLRGASLRAVQAPRSSWTNAELLLADMSGAVLTDADLRNAKGPGTNLEIAQLRGARLGASEFADARLVGADLRGVDAGSAVFAGADLTGARLSGSDLRSATLEGARCGDTELDAVLAHGADLRCDGLTAEQLRLVVGSEGTQLPQGLSVQTCLRRDELSADELERVERAIALYVAASRAGSRIREDKLRERLYCAPAEPAVVPSAPIADEAADTEG